MAALPLPLKRLQRWMQGVVVHPGTVGQALRARPARALVPAPRVGDVILPSPALTPEQRVGIYHGMYLWRMRDALAADYPALEHFLGDTGFAALVKAFIQKHPSRSYTLNRLGDQLPAFVRATALHHRPFCHDLARLELAITEVFDARPTPRLTDAQIAGVPADAWERAVLEPVAGLRVLAFRHPVNAYLESVKDENHGHPKARRRDNWLVIYRREYQVYRQELTRQAHDLLKDLVRGRPLGRAISAALRRPGGKPPAEDQLFRWFRDWVAGGLFSAVHTARRRA